ncbi:hypothetical protein KCU77_g8418, partial [Aureobasidium melanogenum]
MTNPPPTLLLHPSSMTLLNHANMDALPLELKQRICSFLTPKELKPLRLTCKAFATAAEHYFINRLVLFLHPDSLATLRKIADHGVFSKFLTTIVFDPMFLTWDCLDDDIVEDPCWDDFRPKTLSLNSHESYAAQTTRVMRDATKSYEAAWIKRHEARARLERLEDLINFQRDPKSFDKLSGEIEYALEKCRRLKNVVVASRHPAQVEEVRDRVFKVQRPFAYWNYFELYDHRAILLAGKLQSLILDYVKIPSQISLEDAQITRGLKHLRIQTIEVISKLDNMRYIFKVAKNLETLSLSVPYGDITKTVKVIRSDSLQVCLMNFRLVQGDALVEFLLHHAHSLQRLALGLGMSDIGWAPVLSRISGEFPNLERVQLEALRSRRNRYGMARIAESQAERFVLAGGLLPLIKYTASYRCYRKAGRGFFSKDHIHGQPPPGVWQDYESLADGSWDGVLDGNAKDEGQQVVSDDDEDADEQEYDTGEDEDD